MWPLREPDWPFRLAVAPSDWSQRSALATADVWRGYRDCVDIDVLPAAKPVPVTSLGMYGAADAEAKKMVRVDHCQYSAGTVQLYTRGGDTCTAIPPRGATNAAGQTSDAALAACTDRCLSVSPRRCSAVNVVPAEPPNGIKFATDLNVPWGEGNCDRAAFLAAEVAGSSVCYAFKPQGSREVEEAWTVSDTDPEDQVFYSTYYRAVDGRTFDGPTCGADCAPPLRGRARKGSVAEMRPAPRLTCAWARNTVSIGIRPTARPSESVSSDDGLPLVPRS